MIHITAERFIPEIDKLTVAQLRAGLEMSRSQLAELSEVSSSCIGRMEDPNYEYCISYEASLRVANALGVEFHRVRWLHPHSDIGRPVGSGRPLRVVKRHEEVCKKCFITLPATGICDNCS